MKVQNTTIFMGDSTRSERHNGASGEKKSQGNIFAGDFGKNIDPIAQKQQIARKKAMKVVSDAWAGDKKIDDDLAERRNRIKEYEKSLGEANKELKQIRDEQSALKEAYGIEEGSQEEQDLKLLQKQAAAGRKGLSVALTEEERERLAQIEKNGGPTEYQQRYLALDESAELYENQATEAEEGIKCETSAIKSIKGELLKSQTMIKAKQSADDIMEAARKEVIGMLVDEAKDHIDEEMEEKKEAAQEKAEEKKEEEEKLEKIREEKEAKEEFAEDVSEDIVDYTELMTEADSTMDDVQREIKKIMEQMKLVEEDIKGAAVDTVG